MKSRAILSKSDKQSKPKQTASSATWKRTPLFDPDTVLKLTQKKIPLKTRLRLLFVRNNHAFEPPVMIRFKRYNGVMYINKVRDYDT